MRTALGRFASNAWEVIWSFVWKHIKNPVMFFFKWTVRVSAIVFVLGLLSAYVTAFWPNDEVEYEQPRIHIQTVEAKEKYTAPVLDRICGCESEGNRKAKGKQYNKDGTLVLGINIQQDGTKSVDIGACQINEKYFEAEAVELGYNIYEEDGNRAMAKWIYENHGTWPWDSSKHCWK